jgi:hypothetical protein
MCKPVSNAPQDFQVIMIEAGGVNEDDTIASIFEVRNRNTADFRSGFQIVVDGGDMFSNSRVDEP